MIHLLCETAVLLPILGTVPAAYCPPPLPGPAEACQSDAELTMGNAVFSATWTVDGQMPRSLKFVNRLSPAFPAVRGGELFTIVLNSGREIRASDMRVVKPLQLARISAVANARHLAGRSPGWQAAVEFEAADGGINVRWSAQLRDADNALITIVRLTALKRELPLREMIVLDATVPGAEVRGSVQGSPVVADQDRLFLACQHPLADNRVIGQRVLGGRQRRSLRAGQTMELSAAMGVAPPSQLRRGFLYYLERHRAHPYRPFLHYNSWYDLNIARKDNHMTEAECLDVIEHIGRELIGKRGVQLDAFVWDDGCDDFRSLWHFHSDFPHGFVPLKMAAARYHAAMGVWISPWGGYGAPRKQRLEYGKAQGYEINERGFSMAGPKYSAAFRDTCLNMMRQQGVAFFKFDGMGAGNMSPGARAELADDVDAVLDLTNVLRQENPELFISATVGTWPSPYWTFYADSIWRQGGDTGFHGAGNPREQWITYRDMFAHQGVVLRGPLYPLNSVMFHGLTIGSRANPGKMPRDEASVSHEIWMTFGCGMGLQELYITPRLLTQTMWDQLAQAAKWSRRNQDVLVDSHWVGGDPGQGEVYGYASWSPRQGILVLRNPDDQPQSVQVDVAEVFQLPPKAPHSYRCTDQRHPDAAARTLEAGRAVPLELKPFQVLVLDATPSP